MTSRLSVRVNFDEKEQENITFLLDRLSLGTVQGLIRHLIAKSASEAREFDARYKGGGVSRETSADGVVKNKATAAAARLQRAKEMESWDDARLSDALKQIGAIESDTVRDDGSSFKVRIGTAKDGLRRVIYEDFTDDGISSGESNGKLLAEVLAKCVRDRLI